MKPAVYVRCESAEIFGDRALVSIRSMQSPPTETFRVVASSILRRDCVAYVPACHLDSDSLGEGKREILAQLTSAVDHNGLDALWVHEDLLIEVAP